MTEILKNSEMRGVLAQGGRIHRGWVVLAFVGFAALFSLFSDYIPTNGVEANSSDYESLSPLPWEKFQHSRQTGGCEQKTNAIVEMECPFAVSSSGPSVLGR